MASSTPVRLGALTQASAATEPSSFSIQGIRVSAISFSEVLERLLAAPARDEQLRVHFAAAHTLAEASRDEALRKSLAQADLVLPDGTPLVWLGRLKGRRSQRVSGPDMMPALLEQSQGLRHFFYGGTDELLTEMLAILRQRFPGIEVAGSYAPPFRPLTEIEVEEIAARINASEPDYVWVGLGSPQQDFWLATFRPLLDAAVLLSVGAAFSFQTGRLKRAPRWAQRWGLEWAFRLLAEPRRLAGRYALTAMRLGRILIAELADQRRGRGPV